MSDKEATRFQHNEIKRLKATIDEMEARLAIDTQYIIKLEATISELTAKANHRDFQDEVLEETGRLLDESQATITEMKELHRAILNLEGSEGMTDAKFVQWVLLALKETN